MASASAAVNVTLEPAPAAAPPLRVLPGMIVSRLVPSPASWLLTDALAPSPSATMAMTAATPMMMPSVVRMLRPLLDRNSATADAQSRILCRLRGGLRFGVHRTFVYRPRWHQPHPPCPPPPAGAAG